MQPRQPVPADLRQLAELQDHVLTREQCLGDGLGRHAVTRLLATDQWRPLARGIYLTLPTLPSWRSQAWAGVLIGGDFARLGGMAAAYLHGLITTPPDRIRVLVPANRGAPTADGPWVFSRELHGVRSGRSIGSPPRLPIDDLVLDLIDQADEAAEVVHWVTTAVQNRLTTEARLRGAMTRRSKLRHRRVLAELVDDVAVGVRSPLELR